MGGLVVDIYIDQINMTHFLEAMKRIRVSGIQMAEKPEPVFWNDIGGLQETKVRLRIIITKEEDVSSFSWL